jgi:hypothetical protein
MRDCSRRLDPYIDLNQIRLERIGIILLIVPMEQTNASDFLGRNNGLVPAVNDGDGLDALPGTYLMGSNN